MSIKLNSASGSVTMIPEDGSGNVNFTVPRTGFLATSALGSTVQAYDANIMVDGDIGTTVQAYDANTAKLDEAANFTGALQNGGSNVVVDTDIGTAVGFSNIPQNSQSAPYTLVLSDSGKHILHPSADTTARVFTIPANAAVAYTIGTAITFINENSAGVVTISITSDTMRIAGDGTTGNRTLAANGMATAVKVTATSWIIAGSGLE